MVVIFAPSLFVGAYLGYFFSRIVNMFSTVELPENNFTIVGMAGILSGIYHAPLTAIFLIAEITGGYTLMIPLMIVSSISFAISRFFEPFPMDTKHIAESGDALTPNRDKNVLSAINTMDFVERDYPTLSLSMNLGELVDVVSNSTRNVFPVLSQKKELVGLIWLDDIRDIMFKQELYHSVKVSELMVKPSTIVTPESSMEDVMKQFDETGLWVLPVVSNSVYEGFISKTNVFTGYRKHLKISVIE